MKIEDLKQKIREKKERKLILISLNKEYQKAKKEVSKLDKYVTLSCRVRPEVRSNFYKRCFQLKLTPSEYMRELLMEKFKYKEVLNN